MNIKISDITLEKIRCSKNGMEIADKLLEITTRPNNEYNRGVLHGFLFTLTMQDIITGDEGIAILEQIRRS